MQIPKDIVAQWSGFVTEWCAGTEPSRNAKCRGPSIWWTRTLPFNETGERRVFLGNSPMRRSASRGYSVCRVPYFEVVASKSRGEQEEFGYGHRVEVHRLRPHGRRETPPALERFRCGGNFGHRRGILGRAPRHRTGPAYSCDLPLPSEPGVFSEVPPANVRAPREGDGCVQPLFPHQAKPDRHVGVGGARDQGCEY